MLNTTLRGRVMRKLTFLLTTFIFALSINADSQVVYFPTNSELDMATQMQIQTLLKEKCETAFFDGHISVVDTKIEFDYVDQGVTDKYTTLTLEVEYFWTNDDISDEIVVTMVEDMNYGPEEMIIDKIDFTGEACK